MIDLDAMISDLHDRVRTYLADGAPFVLQFEQFSEKGEQYWRALVRIGDAIWQFSERPHLSPSEALNELHERMLPP